MHVTPTVKLSHLTGNLPVAVDEFNFPLPDQPLELLVAVQLYKPTPPHAHVSRNQSFPSNASKAYSIKINVPGEPIGSVTWSKFSPCYKDVWWNEWLTLPYIYISSFSMDISLFITIWRMSPVTGHPECIKYTNVPLFHQEPSFLHLRWGAGKYQLFTHDSSKPITDTNSAVNDNYLFLWNKIAKALRIYHTGRPDTQLIWPPPQTVIFQGLPDITIPNFDYKMFRTWTESFENLDFMWPPRNLSTLLASVLESTIKKWNSNFPEFPLKIPNIYTIEHIEIIFPNKINQLIQYLENLPNVKELNPTHPVQYNVPSNISSSFTSQFLQKALNTTSIISLASDFNPNNHSSSKPGFITSVSAKLGGKSKHGTGTGNLNVQTEKFVVHYPLILCNVAIIRAAWDMLNKPESDWSSLLSRWGLPKQPLPPPTVTVLKTKLAASKLQTSGPIQSSDNLNPFNNYTFELPKLSRLPRISEYSNSIYSENVKRYSSAHKSNSSSDSKSSGISSPQPSGSGLSRTGSHSIMGPNGSNNASSNNSSIGFNGINRTTYPFPKTSSNLNPLSSSGTSKTKLDKAKAKSKSRFSHSPSRIPPFDLVAFHKETNNLDSSRLSSNPWGIRQIPYSASLDQITLRSLAIPFWERLVLYIDSTLRYVWNFGASVIVDGHRTDFQDSGHGDNHGDSGAGSENGSDSTGTGHASAGRTRNRFHKDQKVPSDFIPYYFEKHSFVNPSAYYSPCLSTLHPKNPKYQTKTKSKHQLSLYYTSRMDKAIFSSPFVDPLHPSITSLQSILSLFEIDTSDSVSSLSPLIPLQIKRVKEHIKVCQRNRPLLIDKIIKEEQERCWITVEFPRFPFPVVYFPPEHLSFSTITDALALKRLTRETEALAEVQHIVDVFSTGSSTSSLIEYSSDKDRFWENHSVDTSDPAIKPAYWIKTRIFSKFENDPFWWAPSNDYSEYLDEKSKLNSLDSSNQNSWYPNIMDCSHYSRLFDLNYRIQFQKLVSSSPMISPSTQHKSLSFFSPSRFSLSRSSPSLFGNSSSSYGNESNNDSNHGPNANRSASVSVSGSGSGSGSKYGSNISTSPPDNSFNSFFTNPVADHENESETENRSSQMNANNNNGKSSTQLKKRGSIFGGSYGYTRSYTSDSLSRSLSPTRSSPSTPTKPNIDSPHQNLNDTGHGYSGTGSVGSSGASEHTESIISWSSPTNSLSSIQNIYDRGPVPVYFPPPLKNPELPFYHRYPPWLFPFYFNFHLSFAKLANKFNSLIKQTLVQSLHSIIPQQTGIQHTLLMKDLIDFPKFTATSLKRWLLQYNPDILPSYMFTSYILKPNDLNQGDSLVKGNFNLDSHPQPSAANNFVFSKFYSPWPNRDSDVRPFFPSTSSYFFKTKICGNCVNCLKFDSDVSPVSCLNYTSFSMFSSKSTFSKTSNSTIPSIFEHHPKLFDPGWYNNFIVWYLYQINPKKYSNPLNPPPQGLEDFVNINYQDLSRVPTNHQTDNQSSEKISNSGEKKSEDSQTIRNSQGSVDFNSPLVSTSQSNSPMITDPNLNPSTSHTGDVSNNKNGGHLLTSSNSSSLDFDNDSNLNLMTIRTMKFLLSDPVATLKSMLFLEKIHSSFSDNAKEDQYLAQSHDLIPALSNSRNSSSSTYGINLNNSHGQQRSSSSNLDSHDKNNSRNSNQDFDNFVQSMGGNLSSSSSLSSKGSSRNFPKGYGKNSGSQSSLDKIHSDTDSKKLSNSGSSNVNKNQVPPHIQAKRWSEPLSMIPLSTILASSTNISSIMKRIITEPAEWMHMILLRESRKRRQTMSLQQALAQSHKDRYLRPNAVELKQFRKIFLRPPLAPLDSAEKDILWQFRYFWTNKPKSFTLFIRCVDWDNKYESREALNVLQLYHSVPVYAALALLTKEYAKWPQVRNFGVELLKNAPNEELLLYLLQLVQAMCYDIESCIYSNKAYEAHKTDSLPGTGADPLVDSSQSASQNSIHHYNPSKRTHLVLSMFLISRAIENQILANFLFWYLRVERDRLAPQDFDSTIKITKPNHELETWELFYIMYKVFGAKLVKKDPKIIKALNTQHKLIEKLEVICKIVSKSKGKRSDKILVLRDQLTNISISNKPFCNHLDQPPDLSLFPGVQKPPQDPTEAALSEVGLGLGSSTSTLSNNTNNDTQSTDAKPIGSVGKEPTNGTVPFNTNTNNIKRTTRKMIKTASSTSSHSVLYKKTPPGSGSGSGTLSGSPSSSDADAHPSGQSGAAGKPRTPSLIRESVHNMAQKIRDEEHSKNNELIIRVPNRPDISANGIQPSSATIFKSALAPVLIPFTTLEKTLYRVIFKVGDDIRQDQLMIQMITLMDKLLKDENMDLSLTPYQVLATGKDTGLVEFVSNSVPLAAILADYRTLIQYWIAHDQGDAEAPLGIKQGCMDRYLRSTAGYCVITYLMGVGDRHNDNLLITHNGCLFHIDFGFILGKDPKIKPPPFKLVKDMVIAMGGEDHEYYHRFKTLCCETYNILRKNANLVINLFALMADASIPDFAENTTAGLEFIQDRFKLEMTDEHASEHFEKLIHESANALIPKLIETAHLVAQKLRS